MVLVFLKGLRPEFFKARPSVNGNSTVKSLEDTQHFLREVPSESHNLAIVETQDHYALTVQSKTAEDRGRGVILELEAVVVAIQENEQER